MGYFPAGLLAFYRESFPRVTQVASRPLVVVANANFFANITWRGQDFDRGIVLEDKTKIKICDIIGIQGELFEGLQD